MKANELMLGDWVYGLYPNGSRYASPFRISAVDIYPLNRSPRIVTMGGYGFHEEHLEPIPITPEILKKNGWSGYDFYRTYGRAEGVFNDDYSCEIGFDNGDCFLTVNAWEYTICEINGVHELQHALRLCGLNELADNFKV